MITLAVDLGDFDAEHIVNHAGEWPRVEDASIIEVALSTRCQVDASFCPDMMLMGLPFYPSYPSVEETRGRSNMTLRFVGDSPTIIHLVGSYITTDMIHPYPPTVVYMLECFDN